MAFATGLRSKAVSGGGRRRCVCAVSVRTAVLGAVVAATVVAATPELHVAMAAEQPVQMRAPLLQRGNGGEEGKRIEQKRQEQKVDARDKRSGQKDEKKQESDLERALREGGSRATSPRAHS
mmetsp:Transcript_1234/g.3810  ORF Transcript_1234/g.3810 Transcript_1234/m.3810 type:complete len:122 (+) Transcript_1234:1249-1614(+)